MPLSAAEKELVNIGASVATGCKPCTDYHFQKLRQLNAPDEQIRRAIRIIVEVLQGAETLEQVQGSRRLRDSIRALEDSVPLTLEASDRVARLFSGLKSFIRVDEAEFQLCDLHEGLQSVLTLAEHELQGRIEVKKQLGEIPRIPCYPAELNQVLMALLTNAIQAIEGRGSITIRTHLEGGAVHLELSDTGVGIPPEALNRLFVPEFARKGSRVKTRLGLFTSYNIIQKHGGEIRVRSEPGQGSTFTLVLPTDLQHLPREPAENGDDRQPAHRCDKQ
jgi:AhpD family alkylhydroperoxidase